MSQSLASPSQKAAFKLYKLKKEDGSLYIPFGITFEGMDFNLMEKSLNILIERHQILRSTFYEENGIYIKVHKNLTIKLSEVYDLKDFLKPFILEKGPLIRSCIYNGYVYINLSHILVDGESVSILIKELKDIYESLYYHKEVSKICDNLKDSILPIKLYEDSFQYYKERLKDNLQGTLLPSDFIRNGEVGGPGESFRIELEGALWKNILESIHKYKISPFVFCKGCFDLTLSEITGSKTIITGTNFSCRNPENINSVNLYTSTVPLITHIREEKPEKFFTRINKEIKESKKNQYLDLEELKSYFNLDKNTLINNLFTFENPRLTEITFLGKECKLSTVPSNNSAIDLSICFFPSNNPFMLVFFRKDLFKFQTIRNFIKAYINKLDEMATY